MVAKDQTETFMENKPRRKGLLARFKRNKKKQQQQTKTLEKDEDSPIDNREETSSEEGMMTTTKTPPCTPPSPITSNSLISRGGRVDIPPPLVGQSRLPTRSFVKLERPPTAREAAFSGPPRYDWIDIETAAAVKVQAAFRRNQVLKDLEEQGLSTVAIRNRARRRNKKPSILDGNMFACCGMGLAFGDDEYNYREHDKEAYIQRQKERRAREEALIHKYGTQSLSKRYQRDVDEAVEIVE